MVTRAIENLNRLRHKELNCLWRSQFRFSIAFVTIEEISLQTKRPQSYLQKIVHIPVFLSLPSPTGPSKFRRVNREPCSTWQRRQSTIYSRAVIVKFIFSSFFCTSVILLPKGKVGGLGRRKGTCSCRSQVSQSMKQGLHLAFRVSY